MLDRMPEFVIVTAAAFCLGAAALAIVQWLAT
jgi:hypothetical protein